MKSISVASPTLDHLEEKYVLDCLKSTWISSKGKYITDFENEFARFFNIKYAISCSSGTAALHLCLVALGIGPKDEVILPALTFVSCANVIAYLGAKPVFVDIDAKTWNLNSNLVQKKITDKTKAILAVHSYSYPADIIQLQKIAKENNIYLIEDAAESLGTKYKNKYTGTFGNAGCFSFYGNKVITTGEGGMIITRSKTLYDKINLIKNHGMSKKQRYYHPVLGYNYRMTNLQAAVGLGQMKKLKNLIKKRIKIEKTYRRHLSSISGIVLQPKDPFVETVCWLFSVLICSKFKLTRNQLIEKLKAYNIETRPFFRSLTSFPMYKTSKKFPIAKKVASQGINLPCSANLSLSQIKYICSIISKLNQ